MSIQNNETAQSLNQNGWVIKVNIMLLDFIKKNLNNMVHFQTFTSMKQ